MNNNWKNFKKKLSMYEAYQTDNIINIRIDGKVVTVEKGKWVVKNKIGKIKIYTNEEFYNKFEEE